MGAIVPRWEWRSFGPAAAVARAAIGDLRSTAVQESDETYLVAEGNRPATVKVRGGMLDIKELVALDTNGLEQWRPVLKEPFPVTADAIRAVVSAFGLPPLPDAAGAATPEDLPSALAALPGLRLVAVHKRRDRYEIGGCTAEITDVVADGLPIQTVAIESPDASAVVRAVRSVGLAGYVNTSYGAGLAWALRGTPERYAVLDVGTNSVKFHVSERRPDGAWQTVVDRAALTRLGEGLQETGQIQPQALQRTVEAIGGMVEEARGLGVFAVAAVGTAGLRIAGNGGAVLETIRDRTGVDIDVISGEDEARLAYLAVMASLGGTPGSLAVFDTGGGSTQLTFGHGERVDERFSVNVGAVPYTERFGLAGPVSTETLASAMAAIAADLDRLDGRPPVDALVGMGGAVTNLTAVKHELAVYDPDVVHGTVLDREEIDRQIERYRTTSLEARREIRGLQPARAEVILAGACVVRTLMDKLGKDSLTVSDRGLRHGVLAERFGAVPARTEGGAR